jgi:SAM-dependent methyltransferase
MVRNRFYAAIPGTCPSPDLASFCSDPQALPLAKGAVSAVMLHHILDCAKDPRELIREVARVIEPGGRLLISGFNPYSGWGLSAMKARPQCWLGAQERGIVPIRLGRLLDWLALLGFELSGEVRYAGFALPRHQVAQRAGHWLVARGLPLGSSYLVSATKQQGAAIRRQRRAHLARQPLAPVAYPKLSTWRRVEQDR